MAKYILLYRGPEWDTSKMTQEDMDASMAQWGKWMEGIGPAMVEMGAPMVNGVSIVDNGSGGSVSDMNGYSIVQADSMDAAKKLVDGHPHLNGDDGKYSVEVFELTPM